MNEHVNKEIETEYKALVSLEKYEYLRDYLPEIAEPKTPYTQVNYYFDTKDFFFIKNSITIRIRHKKETWELQLKIPNFQVKGEYNQQQEINLQISEEQAREFLENGLTHELPSLKELYQITDFHSNADIKMIGSLETYRRDYMFYTDVISLDKSSYLGITEYELEWETTNHRFVPYELKRLKLKTIKSEGKITRFLARLLNEKEKSR